MNVEIQKKIQLWPIWKIKQACDILFAHQGVILIIELLQRARVQVFIYSVWSKCLKLLSTVDFSGDEWKKLPGPLRSRLLPWCGMTPGISPVYIIPVCSRSSRGIVQTLQRRGHGSRCCRAAPLPPASWRLLDRQQLHGTGSSQGRLDGHLWQKSGGKGEKKERTGLKWNVPIWVGKMSPVPRWNCPDRLSYPCPCHTMCLDSQENGWMCYPDIE